MPDSPNNMNQSIVVIEWNRSTISTIINMEMLVLDRIVSRQRSYEIFFACFFSESQSFAPFLNYFSIVIYQL